MENLGITSSFSKTLPTFSLVSGFVMTLPAFISDPVPTMVSTQPRGTTGQAGSSKRTKYFCQGSSSQWTEAATALV